jgi:UDP-N-acetylmuramoyl-tripeptide--D-alanyl-D-alanine ligase
MIIANLIAAFFLFSLFLFSFKRGRLFMHFFQQEEYDNKRFFYYIFSNPKLIDKKLTISLIAVFLLLSFLEQHHYTTIYLAIVLQIFALIQINPCSKNVKKALVITARVKRIFALFLSLIIAIYGLFYLSFFNISGILFLIVLILFIHSLALLLILSNLLLQPYEKYIQNFFLKDAKQKLKDAATPIIAITGSYGKTSTKYILHNTLSFVASSLSTPGSVNTSMGISRIIREKLKKEHKYFIVEMGAYGVGSIKRLCDLASPNHGIITAVGDSHYERFKSLENVAKAKFELNQAINHNNGKTIINSDAIDKEFIKKYGKNLILVGSAKDNDYVISQIKQTTGGLKFKIENKGKIYDINSSLFGLHHAHNIALSFAMAHNLGIDVDAIIAAQKNMPQIKHRLEVIKAKDQPIIIDDAYNSNPDGFIAALKITKLLKKDGGRSILVTPGMVELGDLHQQKHEEVAIEALKNIDIAIIIKPKRIQSFVKLFTKEMKKSQQLICFDGFVEAKKWIDENSNVNDVILYENDLPDLYENQICL